MNATRDNALWLEHLRTPGPQRDTAIQDLLSWLQTRLFFYLRERHDLRGLHDDEVRALSADFAQDSVLMILEKLEQFQGRRLNISYHDLPANEQAPRTAARRYR